MTYWSGEKLAERLPNLVVPFSEDKIDCAAYRLTVGGDAYVTPAGGDDQANTRTKQQLPAGGALVIPPGQFGFLTTEEIVHVPTDALAFISIRAKVKLRGLVNVSGFHVDPGYHGRLVFAVFNAGPAPVHLARGDDCFLMWFADLDRASQFAKSEAGHAGLSSDLINPIAGEVQSFAGLLAKIDKNKKDAEKQIAKVERDHVALNAAIGFVVLIAAAWFGREFLPQRAPSAPAPIPPSHSTAPAPS